MLEIGSIIDGKYKILNKIGQGGMSVVYLAMNEKANKQWAIKEVRKDGVKDFEVVKQGLVGEIEMLKRLNHPNLPSIIDVIETDGTFLIVMDYIEGNTLSGALNDYGAQSQENVILWAKQLCDVLGYLHTRTPPIIYRDMKPSNIMLKPDGKVMLIDFGTAREYKEQNLADTTCLGTQGYAAPEQFGGQGQTDPRTDIYTLGATLYHLITGHNPCEPPYEMYPIKQWNQALSSGLERIILKCTMKNPNDRYENCAELMYDLEHYEEIDNKYKKKQKGKLSSFIVCVSLSILLGIGSFSSFALSDKRKTVDYNHMVETGQYLEAIMIEPSKKEAYLGLLKQDKNDSAFSDDEANAIRKLENNKDIDFLKIDSESYAEVCYQIATAFWFYSESDQATHNEATKWFSNVVSVTESLLSSERKRDRDMAVIYQKIGIFYMNEVSWNKEGGAPINAYSDYWTNINKLLVDDDGSNQFVTIKLMNEIVRESVQRQRKLNNDLVSNQQIIEMINKVEIKLKDVVPSTDEIAEQKDNLLALCNSQLKILS